MYVRRLNNIDDFNGLVEEMKADAPLHKVKRPASYPTVIAFNYATNDRGHEIMESAYIYPADFEGDGLSALASNDDPDPVEFGVEFKTPPTEETLILLDAMVRSRVTSKRRKDSEKLYIYNLVSEPDGLMLIEPLKANSTLGPLIEDISVLEP